MDRMRKLCYVGVLGCADMLRNGREKSKTGEEREYLIKKGYSDKNVKLLQSISNILGTNYLLYA